MIERAIVHEIKGDMVLVKCQERCSSCAGCSRGKNRVFQTWNTKKYPLKTGDLVDVNISPLKALKAGFLVLILPLLLFFPFYYTCGLIWTAVPEPVKVLTGSVGIACGFFINLVLKRSMKNDLPEIFRVVSV